MIHIVLLYPVIKLVFISKTHIKFIFLKFFFKKASFFKKGEQVRAYKMRELLQIFFLRIAESP